MPGIRCPFPECTYETDGTDVTFASEVQPYWQHRDRFSVVDSVVMMVDRVVVPTSLRKEVCSSLHAAPGNVEYVGESESHSVLARDNRGCEQDLATMRIMLEDGS